MSNTHAITPLNTQMGAVTYPQPVVTEPGRKLDLRLQWKGEILTVERIISQSDIAIVFCAQFEGGKRCIVKVVRRMVTVFRPYRHSHDSFFSFPSSICPASTDVAHALKSMSTVSYDLSRVSSRLDSSAAATLRGSSILWIVVYRKKSDFVVTRDPSCFNISTGSS